MDKIEQEKTNTTDDSDLKRTTGLEQDKMKSFKQKLEETNQRSSSLDFDYKSPKKDSKSGLRFNRVFDLINNQRYEKQKKQAFYNLIALVLTSFVLLAALSCYFVLQPFLR